MSDPAVLVNELQDQYSVLGADIAKKFNKIGDTSSSLAQSRQEIENCQKMLQDARELVEQMIISARQVVDEGQRQKLLRQLAHYQTDVSNLQKDFKKVVSEKTKDELFGDDELFVEDQKTQLLSNTESLERSNRRLEEGYRVAIETEQIGADVLKNLESQRTTISSARDRLRITDEDLSDSSRVLNRMIRRVIQNRALLMFVIGFLILIFIILIINAFRKTSKA